ncbi:MAG TPA: ATP-binding protein [Leptospiraceae bacterium]|nr:ATP-binding protein [Leptospiraceae bacterium]
MTDINTDMGYRLLRMEFLNWGTFSNGKIFAVDTNGKTALITGANGSGKSTLVDALLTLLVPSQKRNYNLASGTERKRDRDEKTYIQGNYGKTTDETQGSKILKMRDPSEGHISVLLAVFYSEEIKRYASISQVLWFNNGNLEKFYVVAERELNIKDDFKHKGDIKNFKKVLKNQENIKVFDSFKEYIHEFIKNVGLRSEKALDLFNQIVAIKSIGNLKEFIREHMLEKHDVNELIEDLDKNYKNLNDSYNAILQARRQLEELIPIEEESVKYEKIVEEIHNIQGSIFILPAFFAREKINLLKENLESTKFNLEKMNDIVESNEKEIIRKREEERSLYATLENDSIGRRITELQKQLIDERKILVGRQSAYDKYKNLAASLLLQTKVTQENFYENKKLAEEKIHKNLDLLKEIEKKRDHWVVVRNTLHNQKQELESELNSLKTRKDLLPGLQIEIRKDICNFLEIPEDELPYASELMQVKSRDSEWKGAIEKLLNNFGRSLIVPDEHYSRVNAYINKTKLKGKLVYFRMFETDNKNIKPSSPKSLFYKLEFKPNSLFTHWIETRILNDFNYICADSLKEFQEEDRAITKEGLIKHSRTRHEKDDRSSIHDKARYILGWSNTDKVKALEEELKNFDNKYSDAYSKMDQLEKEKKAIHKTDLDLREILRFESFTELDIASIEKVIQETESHKKDLENSTGDLTKIQSKLTSIKSEIQKLEKEKSELEKKRNNLDRDMEEADLEIKDCESVLKLIKDDEFEKHKSEIEKRVTGTNKLSLSNIKNKQNELHTLFEKQREDREEIKQRTLTSIVRRMEAYIKNFEVDTTDLTAEIESISDFRKELSKIQNDKLPEFQDKFRRMMDEKVAHQIAEFRENMVEQEKEIIEKIDELNEALENIDYIPGYTFIQLDCQPTANVEILDFKKELIDCIPDLEKPEENESKFIKIRDLLDKLKNRSSENTDRWVKLVTDVRNWLDFRAIELTRDDRKQKEVYDSSAGKSGGQTVKLAYTILASAISYQFGIREKKSFRLVVIDEMFNNLDNQNSRFAMDLFKQLGLQLLVVTPLDKISIVEPYISSIHLVANNQEGKDSRVYPITMETLRKKKEGS